MQDAMYIHCAIKNHELIVPNACLFDWESDLVGVLRSGFICEFEIKISRADFKADAKKRRAKILVDPTKIVWRDPRLEFDVRGTYLEHKKPYDRPNYFYYAVPKGLITADEIPDYAGLIYVNEKAGKTGALYYGTTTEIKPAQRLHKEKINAHQRDQLARAVNVRYWRQRLKSETVL